VEGRRATRDRWGQDCNEGRGKEMEACRDTGSEELQEVDHPGCSGGRLDSHDFHLVEMLHLLYEMEEGAGW
jgi:hypothetical protein